MVAFHFHFSIAPGIKLTMTVVPHWSFYAFLLATMGSLAIGHFALACHRIVSESPTPLENDDTMKVALMNHIHTVEIVTSEDGADSSSSSIFKKVGFTNAGKLTVGSVIVIGIALVLTGAILNTIQFEFRGLTGYFMSDPTDSYSLISVGSNLPAASGIPHNFGVRFIQLAYFLFGLAMPIAFLVALLFLWCTPLSLTFQKGMIVVAEMLNAWNALDVFVLSVIAAMLEIRQFAKFLVGDDCDTINKILKEYMDEELHGDDKCFDVVATMKTVCACYM